MNFPFHHFSFALATGTTLLIAASCVAQESSSQKSSSVEVAAKPGRPWQSYPTRTLQDLPASVQATIDTDLDEFGGLKTRREKASGFFYTKKIGGRWWLVDPLGGLTINRAVVSVTPMATEGGRAALKTKFGDENGWAQQTASLLRAHGFNGTGAWSNDALLRQATPRLSYAPNWDFMGSYGRERGGTVQKSGHLGYLGDAIFVFDPAFEKFCERHAQKLINTKNDPYLLGHFSDNELPFSLSALKNYLALPAADHGHIAAWKWLRARHGATARATGITPRDEIDFLELVAGRYYRIVSQAIKKADPNHLYLGSRLHGAAPRRPEIFRAAAPYLDIVSVNYYGVWTPDTEQMKMWERESGKPFLITEWYAKGEDSGMGNKSGAGWLVKTQADRGKFYQNFTLGLLESKSCVGWQWFKYIDNDPTNTAADPSNLDSNKGIVTARYVTYPPLLDAMCELNARVYGIVDEFDRAQ